MKTVGTIKMNEKPENCGVIEDANGTAWDVISVWKDEQVVTACKSKEVETIGRWQPYKVEIIE